jgi:hypothetical protein
VKYYNFEFAIIPESGIANSREFPFGFCGIPYSLEFYNSHSMEFGIQEF